MQESEFGYMILFSFHVDGKPNQFRIYDYIVYSLEKVKSRIEQIKIEAQQKWVVKDYIFMYRKVYLLKTNDNTRQMKPTIIIGVHPVYSSVIYKDLVYFDKIHFNEDYNEQIEFILQNDWSVSSNIIVLDL